MRERDRTRKQANRRQKRQDEAPERARARLAREILAGLHGPTLRDMLHRGDEVAFQGYLFKGHIESAHDMVIPAGNPSRKWGYDDRNNKPRKGKSVLE